MDINKISNNIKGHVSGADSANQSQQSDKVKSKHKKAGFEDKVTIEKYNHRNERLFAQIELEKLHQHSFDQLQKYKSKLVAYEEAKNKSEALVRETEIGKKINDPDTWGKIAQKIING